MSSLLHVDLTVLRLQNGLRVLIQFVQDNYSRAILGFRAALKWKSRDTMEHLDEICERHGLFYRVITLMCDGGSENAGAVDDFLARPDVMIEKRIALVDVDFSNSMIEAVNRCMKYEYLFRLLRDLFSVEDVLRVLGIAVPEFNNRPNAALYGLTPNEVLSGMVVDKHRFSGQIREAKLARIEINCVDLCGMC